MIIKQLFSYLPFYGLTVISIGFGVVQLTIGTPESAGWPVNVQDVELENVPMFIFVTFNTGTNVIGSRNIVDVVAGVQR